MTSDVSFDAAIEASAETVRLNINGALIGSVHMFAFEGRLVQLFLPRRPDDPRKLGASCVKYGWKRAEPNNSDTNLYHVYRVWMRVDLDTKIKTPAAVFEVPNNAYKIVSSGQQETIKKIINANKDYLLRAFDYWQRVTRWVTGYYQMGAPDFSVQIDLEQQTRILRRSDGRTFWREGGMSSALGGPLLTPLDWGNVQTALTANAVPPLWYDYLADYHHRMIVRDYVGAMLSLVITVETVARAILWRLSGQPSNALAAELIDRANAQTIVGKWDRLLGLSRLEKKSWPLSRMHELFELRNEVVHEGKTGRLSRQLLERFGAHTTDFVERADDAYRAITGAEKYKRRP